MALKVSIRADAYASIGTGHLMRCLALSEALLRTGAHVSIITHCQSSPILERIRESRAGLHLLDTPGSLEKTMELLRSSAPDWVVLDGYHFDETYVSSIKATGVKLLLLDDYRHLEKYETDMILNQNLGAEAFDYGTASGIRTLLGTDYVLLREDFLKYAGHRPKAPDRAQNLLITMGGVDEEDNTSRVIKALSQVDGELNIKVVAGPGNTHIDGITKTAEKCAHSVEILTDVSDMTTLMAWAHLAVSAGGTTAWELAYMGVPSALGVVAANQEASVRALDASGAFVSLGWLRDRSPEELATETGRLITDRHWRERASAAGRRLVDGFGVDRVICAMSPLEYFSGSTVVFRDVELRNFTTLDDKEKDTVLGWRNSVEVRQWMFTRHRIEKQEHYAFIERLSQDESRFYWMALVKGGPAGVGSLQDIDYTMMSADLGIYSVRPGAGVRIMDSILHAGFDILMLDRIRCEVMADNERAAGFYEKRGLRRGKTLTIDVEGSACEVLEMYITREQWLKPSG